MRLEHPLPGDSWPHDMVIRIDDNPNNVNELLFVRSVWGIAHEADIPPLSPQPHAGQSARPPTASFEEWSAAWMHVWAQAWEWYSTGDALQQPSPEFLRASARPEQPVPPSFPPYWRARHGYDGIDRDALFHWMRSIRNRRDLPLEEHPERRSLPALIEAWEGGLATIVTLPYAGYFADRISLSHLVVSNETRADPEMYSRALKRRPEVIPP